MKVKVIVESDYEILTSKANEFMADVNVIDVKVIEKYNLETDNGYVAYHIFYKEYEGK